MTDSKITIMRQIGLKSFWMVMIICAATMSCSKDNQNEYREGNKTFLPITDLEIHPLGDELTFTYTSEEEWQVRVEQESDQENVWITVESIAESSATHIKVKVLPSLSEDVRNATIVFSASGKVLDSFGVTQKKAILDVDNESFTMAWLPSSDIVTVSSNIQWRFEEDDEKDTFKIISDHSGDVTYGKISDGFAQNKDEKIEFAPKGSNLSTQSNIANLRVVPVKLDDEGKDILDPDIKKKLTKDISITQDFLIFEIRDKDDNPLEDGTDYLFGFSELGAECKDTYKEKWDELGESFTKTIKIVLEEGYECSSNIDDFKDVLNVVSTKGPLRQSKADSNRKEYETQLEITWNKVNESSESEQIKTLEFWIESDEDTKHQITAKQDKYLFEINTEKDFLSKVPNGGGMYKFTLVTSGPWTIDKEDWMTVDKEEGFGSAEITVTFDKNLNFEDNSGNFQLKSSLNDKNCDIPVKQMKFTFDVKFDNDSDKLNISRMDNQSHDIKITSDGPWTLQMDAEANADAEWLGFTGIEVNTENGKRTYRGDACPDGLTIKLQAEEYMTIETGSSYDRTKMLSFSSNDHVDAGLGSTGDHIKELTITQESLRTQIRNKYDNADFSLPEAFAAYKEDGSETSFLVKCSAKWKFVISDPDDENSSDDFKWIHFKNSKGEELKGGNGNYELVSLTVDTNDSDKPRNAKIEVLVIVSENKTTTLPLGTIIQKEFHFEVNYDEQSFPDSFSAWNEVSVPVEVEITPGASFYVEVDDRDHEAWIDRKIDGNNVKLTPKHNGSLEDKRDYTVYIKSAVTSHSHPIEFHQDKYEFDKTPLEDMSFDELASTEPYEVDIKCTGQWKINKPDWIKVTDSDGKEIQNGKGNAKVFLKADKVNYLTDPRPGEIEILSEVDEKYTHSRSGKVSQNAYTWNVTGLGTGVLNLDGPLSDVKDYEISVLSSGEWNAYLNKVCDFVTISPDGGNGNKFEPEKLKLDVLPNYSFDPRSVDLIIKSSHWVDQADCKLIEKLSIQQPAYEFKPTKEEISLDAAKDSESSVDVTCSGKLEDAVVPDDAGWLQADVQDGKVVFKTLQANDGEERSTIITITCEHTSEHRDLTTQIKVTQKGI